MTKWRCPIIKNDPSLAETEDPTIYVHYQSSWIKKLIRRFL